MTTFHVRSLARRLGAGLVAAGLLGVPAAFLAPRAHAADEPPPEGEDLQAKIQQKMQEILRLMRENGKAILDASQGGGARPKGVDVTPPPPDGTPPSGTPPPGVTPPPGGMEGSEPAGSGEDVRRRMDELLKQMGSGGAAGAIPKELEELVRMIPRKSSNSSDGSPPPEPGSRKPGEKPKDPQDDPSKKDPSKDPKESPERDPKPKDGDKPPPDGAKEPPREDDTPPWAAELPPEVRRVALNASPEKVPERYRSLLIRYQKWLQERAAKSRDGR